MKNFIAAMIIGTFALATAAPAAAQSKPTSDKSGTAGAAHADDPAAERNSYTNNAQDEMRMWTQKLHDFNTKKKANPSEAQTSAYKNLDGAWTEIQRAWTQLVKVGLNEGTVGPNAWASAQADFHDASAQLTVAWHGIDPAGK